MSVFGPARTRAAAAAYVPAVQRLDLSQKGAIDLADVFENVEYVEHGSASPSVILKATTRASPKRRVLLKGSQAPELRDGADNSLLVEIQIYTKVVTPLFQGRITPHVTPCVGTFRCNEFLRSVERCMTADGALAVRRRWAAASSLHARNGTHDMNMFAANFVAFALEPGVTLREYIHGLDLSTEGGMARLVSAVWQLLYTLHCFVKVGLRHNDLHFKNIMVVETDDEELSYVLTSDDAFTVPTHGSMVRIYDFDFGSARGAMKNTKLDDWACEKAGQCNGENPYFDVFTAIQQLYWSYLEGYRSSNLGRSIHAVISTGDAKRIYFEGSFARDHLMCDQPDGNKKCRGEYKWRDKALPSPRTFLHMDVFKAFRVRVSKCDVMAPTTFFANDALRDALLPGFVAPPAPPVVERQLTGRCDGKPVGWPVGYAGGAIESRMLPILTDWMCNVIEAWFVAVDVDPTHTDTRKVFNMMDELTEYVKKNVTQKTALQLLGVQFLHKFYRIDEEYLLHMCAGAYTSDAFRSSLPSVMDFQSSTNSTVEHLFYCNATAGGPADRYPEVVAFMAGEYERGEFYDIPPAARAASIIAKFSGDGEYARKKFVHTGTPSHIAALVTAIHEPGPLFGASE